MSVTYAIDHLGNRTKFQMEVDEHPGSGNDKPLKSYPSVMSVVNGIESIILIETDTSESNLVITLQEPDEENSEPNGNISQNIGFCDPNPQNSLVSDTDCPNSSCVPACNKSIVSPVALRPRSKPAITSSTPLNSESDSDSASNSSRLTRNSSSDGGYHACTVPGCDKKFSRPSRLLQHSRIHTGERPYICPVVNCGRSYTRSQHLHRHTQITHKAPAAEESQQQASGDNKCSKCGKLFASIYSLRKHLSQYHKKRKYSCTECDQVFLKQQHLRTHGQTHTNKPAFVCDVPGCTASFFLPSKLQRHKLQHVPGRYKCTRDSACQQTFDRHVDLRRHLASQHPFVCSVCGVEFAEQSRYNRHRATHEDLRLTYHCTKPGCGRCYYTLRALVSHVRNSHEQQGSQHECVVCTKRFATKQKLQQHLRTHGPDYGRVVKKVTGKNRKTRFDKGHGRIDYRRLLSGLIPSKDDGNPKNQEAVELEKPANGLNATIAGPSSAGQDRVLGTRRLLEGSAIARQQLKKTGNENISDLHKKSQGAGKLHPSCETFTDESLLKISDSGSINTGLHKVRNVHNEGNAHKGIKPIEDISVCLESDKIGSVFISGVGAIKQSSVILARMSDRMVEMLVSCKLAVAGK